MALARRATAVLGAIVALAACLYALTGITEPAAQATTAFNGYLEEANGHEGLVGSDDVNAGTAVKLVCHTCAGRYMRFDLLGFDSQGKPYGYYQFSNGNYMASNDDCTGITIKSSASSNGVVWTWAALPSPGFLANRYCSGFYMSSNDTVGDQWKTKAPGAAGWFQRIQIFSSLP